MLDVHPPHESAHNWRDILVHIGIMTVGLFIALSLEGLVEWRHHRHLVHEAEASLRREIMANAKQLPDILKDVKQQKEDLAHDIQVLKSVAKTGKLPEHSSMSVTFHIHDFEAVSFKTAQSTGALSYMAYDDAQTYSDIYTQQATLSEIEKQAARDAILALAHFVNFQNGDPDPTPAEANEIINKISVLQGQLLLTDSVMQGLQGQYKAYLDTHPEK